MNNCIFTFRDLQKKSKHELYMCALLQGLPLGKYNKKEIILFLIVKQECAQAIDEYQKYLNALK